MAKRASFQKDFVVQETKGKAGDLSNPDSLASLNKRIVETPPDKPGDVFEPMWTLCLALANQRKLIAKVRGDSNDFLTYATIGYIDRWQKQFGKHDARRPVQQIQNWIPYILNTIRFALISFNKEVFDYDFLPLPVLLKDAEDEEGETRDIPDTRTVDPVTVLALESLANRDTLHSLLDTMPQELKPYLVDILYYIRTRGKYFSQRALNFIKIGVKVLTEKIEQWIA